MVAYFMEYAIPLFALKKYYIQNLLISANMSQETPKTLANSSTNPKTSQKEYSFEFNQIFVLRQMCKHLSTYTYVCCSEYQG